MDVIDDPEFREVRLAVFPLKNSAIRAFAQEAQKCEDYLALNTLMREKGAVLDDMTNDELSLFLAAMGPGTIDLYIQILLRDVRSEDDMGGVARITQLRHAVLEFLVERDRNYDASPTELFSSVSTGDFLIPDNAGVPLDEYRSYIEYHNMIDRDWYTDEERKTQSLAEQPALFAEETPIEEKRRILFLLAHIGRLEAITALEVYLRHPDPALAAWARFCFDECRLFLERDELGETQDMIITGAGGKNGRLRYFIIVMAEENGSLNCEQCAAIEHAFSKTTGQFDSVVEYIEPVGRFTLLSLLIPPSHSPDTVLDAAMEIARFHAPGIAKECLSTNVCKPTEAMVLNWLFRETEAETM